MMTPQQHRSVVELFHAACAVSEPDRMAMVERAAADDVVLERVTAMLARHDQTGHALDTPGPGVALVTAVRDAEREAETPEWIGAYRIARRLGEGGMGVVYAATQANPKRDVAIKVLRGGTLSPERRRRFSDEARALARLQHPGIATIYEAGVAKTETGRELPFLAMELVDGPTILAYTRERRLEPRGIVSLMVQVCEAVHAAHLKGIIHRDLKPANILVAEANGVAQPKTLDFGIARITDVDVDAATLDTDTGRVLGTLAYMSPEQLEGDPNAIDVRVDVHALGLVLYQLLVDRLPIDVSGRGVHEAIRMLATTRATPIRTVDASLAPDLATIVMKSIEREPDRRYASAQELAADLGRFLRHEPIAARPASAPYRVRMFTRRNRALVAAASALALVLVAGTVVGSSLAVLADRARARAERETRAALALNEFVRDDLLGLADPEENPDRDLTLRAALDNAATLIDTRFADDPTIAGRLHETVGGVYLGLGELDAAERHLMQAVSILEASLGPDDVTTLRARVSTGSLLHARGRYAEGLAEMDAVATRLAARFGESDPAVLDARYAQATMFYGLSRHEEGVTLLDEVLRRHVDRGESDSRDAIHALRRLAAGELALGRWESCEAHLERGLEACRRTLGDDHALTARFIEALGYAARDQGRFEEALEHFDAALAVHRVTRGPEHPTTLGARTGRATVLRRLDGVDEADLIDQEVLEIRTRLLGPDHPQRLVSLNAVALNATRQGHLERAATLLDEALERSRRVHGREHRDTFATVFNLAMVRLRQEEYEEAATLFADAADVARSQLPEGHWRIGHYTLGRGRALALLGRPEEAEALLVEAHGILLAALGSDHSRTRKAAEFLAEFYVQVGNPAAAGEWSRRATP